MKTFLTIFVIAAYYIPLIICLLATLRISVEELFKPAKAINRYYDKKLTVWRLLVMVLMSIIPLINVISAMVLVDAFIKELKDEY